MTNNTPISFNFDISPFDFLNLMLENTDSKGNLHLIDLYDVTKDDAVSYRDLHCKIKWNKEKVEKLVKEYKILKSDLARISRHLEDLDKLCLSEAEPFIESARGILKDKQLESTYFIYIAPFKATDKAQLNAEVKGRVGDRLFGYELIRHARRLCKLLQLKAPDKVIRSEERMLIAAMTIYNYGGVIDLKELIDIFIENELEKKLNEDFIYNEFSLQHEFGIFLRNNLSDSTVKFERHIAKEVGKTKDEVKTVKHEIDIVITDSDGKKHAVELKFPKNGQYPEQMFSFIKDIRFCEEMLEYGFEAAYCFTLADDKKFYSNNYSKRTRENDIYKYFRNDGDVEKELLSGDVFKKSGKDADLINPKFSLKGQYHIDWNMIDEKHRYYIIKSSL